MNDLYTIPGITRQNFHQRYKRMLAKEELKEQLLPLIKKLRISHPKMSARTMYIKLVPQGIGRDAFENFAFENGYKLVKTKRFINTTDSTGVVRFPNLLEGLTINKPNQVLVSDITYYWLVDRYYYITLIMDIYTRFIPGCYASDSLMTINTTLPALKLAINTLGITRNSDCTILHSDGGGQYYSKPFIKLTKAYGIKNSMGQIVYDNSHAERVIETIKNYYIEPYNPKNFQQLKKYLTMAVRMYNFERPHSSLNKLTPYDFEQKINKIMVDKRPQLHVFASVLTKNNSYKQKEKRSKKEKVYTL